MPLSGKVRILGVVALSACSLAFGESSAADSGTDGVHVAERAPETAQQVAERAQRFVDERLAVWRQRLKLEDWHISAVMARRVDLGPQNLGGIHWDKTKKSATIWILDPADYALPLQAMLDDMERTVVHELIHLELTSLPKSEAHRGSEERAVSGLAEAMLELERRKQ